ncbi:MAG: EamA family transporter [Rhodobacteraceae bacterium]|nr:EamA family transporter [Paracoccaceae bacterium]
MTRPGLLQWSLLLALGMIWGASFLGVEKALQSIGPISIAAYRITLAAILLTSISYAMGIGLPKNRRIWFFAIGMGLFSNAIPFTLLSWAQQYVTSGYAGITMAVVPLLVLPLSHFLIPGMRLTPKKAAGFGVGFIGVVVLIGPGRILQSGGGDIENIARIACIIASMCYAVGSVLTRLAPQGEAIAFSAAALIAGSIISLPVALIAEGVPAAVTLPALLGQLYLGIFPTALATIMLVYIVKTAGPPFLSLVNYQVPIWAVVIGMVVLDETLPGSFIWALGLILAGLAISQIGPRKTR